MRSSRSRSRTVARLGSRMRRWPLQPHRIVIRQDDRKQRAGSDSSMVRQKGRRGSLKVWTLPAVRTLYSVWTLPAAPEVGFP